MRERRFEVGDKVALNEIGKQLFAYSPHFKTGVILGMKEIPNSEDFHSHWSVKVLFDESKKEKWIAEEFLDLERGTKPAPYRMEIDKLLDRQEEKGVSKYGVTLDKNTTLTGAQRIEHLEEELIDALMYCEHLKAGIGGDNLTADDYQRAALRTAQIDKFSRDDLLQNGVVGLCGEAGEVIDLVKKWKFQGHELDIEEVKQELGDTLWYAAVTAYALGYNLSEVMETNIDKLKERYKDGFSKERSINRKEYKSEKVSADVPD